MWVLIPVKDLDSSKSRLAHALPDHARPALMGALLADLLDLLHSCAEVRGISVVTRCPQAMALAQAHYADYLCLADDHCLNSGVTAAVRELTTRGIRDTLILHGDLPQVEAADIDTVIRAHRHSAAAVTLVPDNQRNGTNAMLLTLPTAMQMLYGQHSYRKHLDYCHAHHIPVQTTCNERLGCDLDLWQDFAPLLSLRTAGNRPQLAHWLELYSELFDWPLAANL